MSVLDKFSAILLPISYEESWWSHWIIPLVNAILLEFCCTIEIN